MTRLAPKTREVLMLRFYQGLALDEIAQALHDTLGAAKMRRYRALQQFHHHYLRSAGSTIIGSTITI
jgi:DNA-directed RNA polymerase specialized sigma24 family protein